MWFMPSHFEHFSESLLSHFGPPAVIVLVVKAKSKTTRSNRNCFRLMSTILPLTLLGWEVLLKFSYGQPFPEPLRCMEAMVKTIAADKLPA